MSKSVSDRPWGRLAGMLGGCYATLAGMWAGLDPEIILVRALIVAVVISVATRVVVELFFASEKAT